MKSRSSLKKVNLWRVFFITIVCIMSLSVVLSLYNFLFYASNENTNTIQNPEKVVLVDVSGIEDPGGIYTLSKYLVQKIAEKRPNWKFLILPQNNANYLRSYLTRNNIVPLHVIRNYPMIGCFHFIADNCKFIPDFVKHFPKSVQHFLGKLKFFFLYSCWMPDADLMFDPRTTNYVNNFYLDRVTVIHDLLCYDIPKLMQNSDYMELATETAAKNSNVIITVSKFSRNKIIDIFDSRNVKVIYIRIPKRLNKKISLEESNKILNRFNLRKDEYIVYPSALWKHKNHQRLILAFEKYLKTYNDLDLKLVLLGGASPQSPVHQMIPEYLKNRIAITDSVGDDTFQVILQNSKAVIQGSLYEGFGMTVLEGMAAGRPVAAGDVASIPEVAGDAVLYFDPYSVDDICRAIHEITTNVELQNVLIERGRARVEKFSNTDQMIDEYIEVLESVMRK